MPGRAIAQTSTNDPIELLERAEVLRRRAEQSFAEYALEAGALLIQAKRRLPHGTWAHHVAEHTGYSLRTCEVYMAAAKRYAQLSTAEKAEVLQQPFTRSLLVLAKAPKALPGADSESEIDLPEKGQPRQTREPAHTNGTTSGAVEDFLNDRGLDTTALIDAAAELPLIETDPTVEHEATPLDDILDAPRQDVLAPEITDEQIRQEERAEFEEMMHEVERLERENRQLQAQLQEASKNPSQMRGWDFVASLYQYLRADEPARTPESLAKRAASLQGGRETVAYLEQFFAATRNHLRLAEGEPLPA